MLLSTNFTFGFGLLNQPVVTDEEAVWMTFLSKTILTKNNFDICSVNIIFGRNTSVPDKKSVEELFLKNRFR